MKSKNLLLSALCVVLSAPYALSQDGKPAKESDDVELLAPDRPGLGEAIGIVQPRQVQLETGFLYNEVRSNYARWQLVTYNQTLVRAGISRTTELRLDYNLVQESFTTFSTFGSFKVSSPTAFVPFRVGFKTRLLENKKWIPTVAFVTMVGLPWTAGDYFRPTSISPTMELSFANPINKWLTICYNVGASWDGINVNPLWYYAASFEFLFNERWGTYLQTHGNVIRGAHAQWANQTGIMFYPTKNIQLDIAGGISYLERGQAADQNVPFFITGGISWRLPR